jgi:hypothetical protein
MSETIGSTKPRRSSCEKSPTAGVMPGAAVQLRSVDHCSYHCGLNGWPRSLQ